MRRVSLIARSAVARNKIIRDASLTLYIYTLYLRTPQPQSVKKSHRHQIDIKIIGEVPTLIFYTLLMCARDVKNNESAERRRRRGAIIIILI